jgi:transposase, IS5 family
MYLYDMKIHNFPGLFDMQEVLEKLTLLGDPLVVLDEHTDFEIFRSELNLIFKCNDEVKAKRGRPSYDVVHMMKILFVQRLYNLSDEQIEFQINDRLSFRRFLGIPLSNAVPDCKTVWLFREELKKEGDVKKLFDRHLSQLQDKGLIVKEGRLMDATIVTVPIQRNSREENKEIKEGRIPSAFSKAPFKHSQKDTDARWTKKNNISFYGYKNHIKADTNTKLILDYTVTSASVHDSVEAVGLITESDRGAKFHADSAYPTPKVKEQLLKLEMEELINEKGTRSTPLTEEQKACNKEKSTVRSRVEHIFGFMYNSMNDGMFVRVIGMARVKVAIGLNNLVYNICRHSQLKKIELAKAKKEKMTVAM